MIGVQGLIAILSILLATSVVGRAADAGWLNNALTRSVSGGTAAVATSGFFTQYTNLDSFIQACLNGALGLVGYFFIFSLLLVASVWVNNLYQEGTAIR